MVFLFNKKMMAGIGDDSGSALDPSITESGYEIVSSEENLIANAAINFSDLGNSPTLNVINALDDVGLSYQPIGVRVTDKESKYFGIPGKSNRYYPRNYVGRSSGQIEEGLPANNDGLPNAPVQ